MTRLASPRRVTALLASALVVGALVAPPAAVASSGGRRPIGYVSGPVEPRPLASPVPTHWLAIVNYFRDRATPNLPDVVEDTDMTFWARWHATYMVETQSGIDHTEDPAKEPWYDPMGHQAAQDSDLAWTSDITADARWAIESWMTAPFHGLEIIDPTLAESGFGLRHKRNVTFKTAAALNVSEGDEVPYGGTLPVLFPGDNKTVYLSRYGQTETPNPFEAGTPCAAYDGTPNRADHTGPPIYLIFGPGTDVEYLDSTFLRGATELEHCAYDGDDYDGGEGINGPGNNMEALNAIFLWPRRPLASETQYTVTIETDAGDFTWSFRVGDIVPPTSRIKRPKQNAVVDQDAFERLVGTSSGDTSRVDVAIARAVGSKCRFMKGNGDFTAKRDCFKQVWIKANGKDNWAYRLPRVLPATFNPRTGAQNGFFRAFSRGRDEVENLESRFNFGRNHIAFHVKP